MAKYSTKKARREAARRTRMRNKHQAQFSDLHTRLTDENLKAVRKIPQEDWDAAQSEDDENAS